MFASVSEADDAANAVRASIEEISVFTLQRNFYNTCFLWCFDFIELSKEAKNQRMSEEEKRRK